MLEKVSKEDKMKYELILGFRLLKGINKEKFNKKYGVDILNIDNIKKLINENRLIDDGENIFVNKDYLYVLNDILVYFVQEEYYE